MRRNWTVFPLRSQESLWPIGNRSNMNIGDSVSRATTWSIYLRKITEFFAFASFAAILIVLFVMHYRTYDRCFVENYNKKLNFEFIFLLIHVSCLHCGALFAYNATMNFVQKALLQVVRVIQCASFLSVNGYCSVLKNR